MVWSPELSATVKSLSTFGSSVMSPLAHLRRKFY
uniref:Uncharacterized protein n=1 Tax=Anguilla anguilla TaxID=7936 RepID=A0A0E9VIG9_ANGAN